ncbi:MAG: helix-turn-helix transcriptional regulator [Burkholderiales bacterium]
MKRANPPSPVPSEMMDTREVAAYLRLKERRIYDLVRTNALPHVRATGKLLFPRAEVDAWLASKSTAPAKPHAAAPAIVAGSHDPLLEWAVRESGSGLAVLACGSRAGLARLAEGAAAVAAMHWLDDSGEYNVPLLKATMPGADVVAIEWARRAQGLVVAPGNPMKLRSVADLARRKARVVARQPDSGSQRLLEHLVTKAKLAPDALRIAGKPALAETDLAAAVHEGRADAGIAIEAAARAHGLEFVPLASERFDLVIRRRDYFEPGVQALLAFVRTQEFRDQASRLGGYDVTNAGGVVFNA